MGRDGKFLFVAKAIRTFSYGYLGVLLPVYLANLGFGPKEIGVAVGLTLLSSAAMTFALRRPAELYGSRTVLLGLSALIIASAILFLTTENPWMVVVAAALGNLAVGAGETGPFLTLEQVIIPRVTPRENLAAVFSLYNLVGYMAAALGAAVVGKKIAAANTLFLVFLIGGVIQFLIYSNLPSRARDAVPNKTIGDTPSQPLIRRIAFLFSLDAFAGGFVVQSLVLYWFHRRFQADLSTLGWIAFGTQFITGLSYLMAAPLGRRIGLVNAMVFSHLISNGLLIAIAFAPSLGWAVALLFSRHVLSQIDVPTRQTFLMSVVEDKEREAAASLTNMSRTLAQAVSPTFTGWIMQSVALSAPFVLGGGLKIIYDLLLYATVKKIGKIE